VGQRDLRAARCTDFPDWARAQGFDRESGARRGLAVILLIVGVVVGCGGLSKTVPAARHAPPIASGPQTGAEGSLTSLDKQLAEAAAWGSPVVSRRSTGHFTARLSRTTPASGSEGGTQSVTVSLGGIGWPISGDGYHERFVGPGPLSRWTPQVGTYTVSFKTDALRVSLLVWNVGGRWQATVDGKPLGEPRSAGSTNHHHLLNVQFPTSRLLTISFALNGGVWFTGLRIGGGDERVAPPTTSSPPPPVTYWLGDSYVVGAGATHPGFDDLAHIASARAGLTDVTIDALGDTGYLQVNAAAKYPNFLTRSRLNLKASRAEPQLIVVGGSINDASFGETRVRQAARALYGYLARAVPKAAVVVVPFTSEYPVPGVVEAANRGVLSAARVAPNVVGVFDLPAQVLALRGAARTERQSGALVSSAVAYHPSEVGHRLYGHLIGDFLRSCIAALRRTGTGRGVCDQPD
jgi:hypothetical protein